MEAIMTALRRRLPNHRACLTFDVVSQGQNFTCSASWSDDGSLAEIFLQNCKAGSMAGINAQDAAVVCSIALQYGAPLDAIRHALLRDPQGRASGPLAAALDRLAEPAA
jgi:hypothetical protein